jgi:hypothetical protein
MVMPAGWGCWLYRKRPTVGQCNLLVGAPRNKMRVLVTAHQLPEGVVVAPCSAPLKGGVGGATAGYFVQP